MEMIDETNNINITMLMYFISNIKSDNKSYSISNNYISLPYPEKSIIYIYPLFLATSDHISMKLVSFK